VAKLKAGIDREAPGGFKKGARTALSACFLALSQIRADKAVRAPAADVIIAVGGLRLDAQRNFIFAGRSALEELKELPVSAPDDFYNHFRRWVFADRATRIRSPNTD